VAYVEGGGEFESEVGVRLAEAGLTDLTEIPGSALAGADLSPFDVLYLGSSTDVSDFVAARENIVDFLGGLVVEPNVFDPASWTWVPFAFSIGAQSVAEVCTRGKKFRTHLE